MSNNSKKKLATSPERYSFSKKSCEKQIQEDPTNREAAQALLDYYLDSIKQEDKFFEDSKNQKNNLEYDLRTSEVVCQKAKSSKHYAQNLYAALCNNEFQKLDVVTILKEEQWGCSWRSAGGIVAHVTGKGDYIDWYCSGIRNNGDDNESEDPLYDKLKYVPEGKITEEIWQDLKNLGWIPAPGGDWEHFE
jgi:hypothetical protein